MTCEQCRYDETYDPETSNVTWSWQDHVCEKCGQTTYCCCTCQADEEAEREQLKAEIKKEVLEEVYELLELTWSKHT